MASNPLNSLTSAITDSCVLAVLPFTGSYRDWSTYAHAVTPISCSWIRSDDRSNIFVGAAAGMLQVADDSVLQVSTGTLFIVGDFNRYNSDDRLFSKDTGAGQMWDWYLDGTANLGLEDSIGTTAAIAMNWVGAKSLAVTFESGQKALGYMNGLYVAMADNATTFNAGTHVVAIGNLGSTGNPLKNPFSAAMIFDEVLTADQLAVLHSWATSRVSAQKTWRGFTRPFTPDLNREENLIAAWDLSKRYNNRIPDLVSGVNDGDVFGNFQIGVPDDLGVVGKFDGVSAAIDCGNDASLRPADALTLVAIVKSKAAANLELINYRKTVSDSVFALYQIRDSSANLCVDDGSANGADIVGQYPSVYNMFDNEWHHVALVFSRADQTVIAYLDGIAGPVTATGGDYPLNSSGPGLDKLYFGCATSILRNANMEIATVKLYDEAKSADWVWRDYQKSFATRILYNSDLTNAQISLANENAGTLSNTDFTIATGSHKVVDDVEVGRAIEGVAVGYLWVPSPQAYGTWQFSLYSAPGTNLRFSFINYAPDHDNLVPGYHIELSNTGEIKLVYAGTAVLFATVPGYVSANTWYNFWVTRRVYDGLFTVYIKGGSFLTWTLVNPIGGSGTNPVASTGLKTSYAMLFNPGAGDRLADAVAHYAGVVSP